MNITCTRIKQLIPMYVESDLEAEATNAIRAHVNGCAGCRALVAEYEASQDWLHTYTPPDFNEALLDSVRLGVMRELQEQGARPTFLARFAQLLTPRRMLAATAMALIIMVALVWYNANRQTNTGLNRIEMAFEKPGEEQPAPQIVPHDSLRAPDGGSFKRVKHHRWQKPASRYLAASNSHRSRQRDKRKPQTDNVLAHDNRPTVPDESVKPQEMLRIELQTADPNIRIIWFAPKETDTQELQPMIETR